jgi:hypothetical protein
VTGVKRRRRRTTEQEEEEEGIKFASQNAMHEALREAIGAFMKMASPDGTLLNMSPLTCSTPVKHLEISGYEWLKLSSNAKFTNSSMIYEMARSEEYLDGQARLR